MPEIRYHFIILNTTDTDLNPTLLHLSAYMNTMAKKKTQTNTKQSRVPFSSDYIVFLIVSLEYTRAFRH